MTSADLPFVLQGLNAPSFRWNGDLSLTVVPQLPPGAAGLTNLLLEPAVLYQKIRNLKFPEGLLYQALGDCVDSQLQKYRVLLGGLERRSADDGSDFTLLQCYDMVYDAIKGLRALYAILVNIKRSRDHIFKAIYLFTCHGDPFISSFALQLHERVRVPFDLIMNEWLAVGVIKDPFNEFFIEYHDTSSIWNDRFAINFEKLPHEVNRRQAQEIYERGKSVYFLRELCRDITYDENMNVVAVLMNRYDLRGHLNALHDYLLLTRGDFVSSLLAEALPVLELPSNRVYRHHLVQILESAIASSNAQYDAPHITSCLDTRMLKAVQHEKAWELFTLEYKIKSPLNVIVDKAASRRYLQIFNMLWNIRWAAAETLECYTIINMNRSNHLKNVKSVECWSLQADTCQMILQFLNQLQSYIYTNVISQAWRALQQEIEFATSVDTIIQAHDRYLDRIVQGALFGGSQAVGELHHLVSMSTKFKSITHDILLIAAQNGDLLPFQEELSALSGEYSRAVSGLLVVLEDSGDEARSFKTRINFNEFYSKEG